MIELLPSAVLLNAFTNSGVGAEDMHGRRKNVCRKNTKRNTAQDCRNRAENAMIQNVSKISQGMTSQGCLPQQIIRCVRDVCMGRSLHNDRVSDNLQGWTVRLHNVDRDPAVIKHAAQRSI